MKIGLLVAEKMGIELTSLILLFFFLLYNCKWCYKEELAVKEIQRGEIIACYVCVSIYNVDVYRYLQGWRTIDIDKISERSNVLKNLCKDYIKTKIKCNTNIVACKKYSAKKKMPLLFRNSKLLHYWALCAVF